MSKANVEIMRGMYEAFNRGEIDRSRETLHPAAELHQPPEMADAGSYRGRDEFVRGLALWLSPWEEPQFEPLDTRAAGSGVVMRVRVSGKGRASGIETPRSSFMPGPCLTAGLTAALCAPRNPKPSKP
jgi:ketosteroid isomerase-like protein